MIRAMPLLSDGCIGLIIAVFTYAKLWRLAVAKLYVINLRERGYLEPFILFGQQPGDVLECTGKMRLICKAAEVCDLSQCMFVGPY